MGTVTDRTSIGLRILGIVYVVVGLVLFFALWSGSIQLLTAVLVGILALIGISLVVIIRKEGIVTRENAVITSFVIVAMGLLFVLWSFTSLPSEIVFAVVFVVGVLAPHILLEHSRFGDS